MSLAVTDLMVAVLVMPVGILTLVKGEFPFAPVYCLAWICLDVLFCTASIMHLCTISVDRYLSLRYPMKFGRNKTRRRVILKIVFVWLLSIAMSLPLSLMYSKDFNSVLVNGSCQIPDPLYKLIGSIVSFYIPLGVMILTYTLTVRHLAAKKQNLQTGITHNSNPTNARRSWRRMLRRNYRRTRSDETDIRSATGEELTGVMTVSAEAEGRPQSSALSSAAAVAKNGGSATTGNGTLAVGSRSVVAAATGNDHDDDDDESADGSPRDGHHHHHRNRHHRLVTPTASCRSTPFHHNPSVGSADTEMTSLDTRELWLPDTEPTPSTMSALHQFGAEMLRLSRGLEKVASPDSKPTSPDRFRLSDNDGAGDSNDDDIEYVIDDDDDDDDEDGNCDTPFKGGCDDSMCSEDTTMTTGTPRCRRAKRQRRRRRRRSGTLHESMRRRFDGHNHHHMPHPYYHHPHHHLHHHHASSSAFHHHHRGRPTRVRSFHEDELRRHHQLDPTATAAVVPAVAANSGPKIVGTLLKPEYQRKPGLDEEICLLPPPPRRRQQRCSASNSSGDTTAAPSPASMPRRPAPTEGTPPLTPSHTPSTPRQHQSQKQQDQPQQDQPQQDQSQQLPHQQHKPQHQQKQHQQKQRHATLMTEWSAASNATATTLAVDCGKQPLRRAMTQKLIRKRTAMAATTATTAGATGDSRSPLTRYGSTLGLPSSLSSPSRNRPQQQVQAQKSNSASRSSVMIRNSYRHGRIIRLEQKATKVLGVVFFTFVFLWTPFFALNLLPSVCPDCEANTNKGLIDLVTWLGYASSMVNPVFYTIFNKVFRQAFKRVLLCKYSGRSKRHSWPPAPPARKV